MFGNRAVNSRKSAASARESRGNCAGAARNLRGNFAGVTRKLRGKCVKGRGDLAEIARNCVEIARKLAEIAWKSRRNRA